MAMSLGDFFAAAPHARPVNPKPFTFTAVSRGKTLPGGSANPHGRPVAAQVTGAFAFIGGDGAQRAQFEARRSLRERFPGEIIEPADVNTESVYQEMFLALREWDADNKRIGGHLFESVDLLRELVEVDEIVRMYRAYREYVREEHPEVADTATFRAVKSGG